MKSSIAHILLPTDFSPRSIQAVKYATTISRKFHSTLTLLHVLPPIDLAFEIMGNGGECLEQVLARQREFSESKLDAFAADELRGFDAKRVLLENDPAQAIVEYSRAHGIDLMIIPTRGGGVFRRFLLGSVTAKVLHDAPCPVWTGTNEEQMEADGDWKLRNVLCAMDPVAADEAALRWAAAFASAFDAHLSVAHAIPSPSSHGETYGLESQLNRLLDHDFKDRIAKMLETIGNAGVVDIHVQNGPAARIVRSVAQDTRADLIVIGQGANSGLPGRLHTNAYAIVREAPCPVVIA